MLARPFYSGKSSVRKTQRTYSRSNVNINIPSSIGSRRVAPENDTCVGADEVFDSSTDDTEDSSSGVIVGDVVGPWLNEQTLASDNSQEGVVSAM